MKKWHKCEEVKRTAVTRIQEMGGSPPRCVQLHSQLPPTGNPQSPVSTPVMLPPPFAVTGEQWSISAEEAWAHARKVVQEEQLSQGGSEPTQPDETGAIPPVYQHGGAPEPQSHGYTGGVRRQSARVASPPSAQPYSARDQSCLPDWLWSGAPRAAPG